MKSKKPTKGGVKNINAPATAVKKATPTKRNINTTETAAPRYLKKGGQKRKM